MVGQTVRRDPYSIIAFNESPRIVVRDDYISDADHLLSECLQSRASGGTNFGAALDSAKSLMELDVGSSGNELSR